MKIPYNKISSAGSKYHVVTPVPHYLISDSNTFTDKKRGEGGIFIFLLVYCIIYF